MRRREFITLVGGATAWPVATHAQQSDRVRQIGMLTFYSQTDREGQARIAVFVDTLQRLGSTDGRNVRIEYRWSAGDAVREKASAAELVRSTTDVIVVAGWTGLAELQRLTSTIPVVFTQVSDPVGSGFVTSLARPGGNISGFQNFEPAIGGKWLGVIKEAVPNMRRAAVLFGSDSVATVSMLHAAAAVAPSLDVEVIGLDVAGGVEIERAIATFASQADGGLVVTPHPSVPANRGSIILLAAQHRLPTVYPFRYFAAEGGLMSYGPDQIHQIDQWRGAATYVDRILRGEKPGDLPVQAPTEYKLVVNSRVPVPISRALPILNLAPAGNGLSFLKTWRRASHV
jgi:ABC-type uncharacterized transport system substrate-binding protein